MRLHPTRLIAAFLPALLGACTALPLASDTAQLRQEVADTERAFAMTMAKRDHAGFVSFLAEETVFFSGEKPLHGKSQVAAWWQRYFDKPSAPFSWKPEQIEVLDSGNLALSSGPVHDPQGKLIGTFTSIWRKEAGAWRIIFDKGNEVCDCPKP